MSILLLADQCEGVFTPASLRLLARATRWGEPVHLWLRASPDEHAALRALATTWPAVERLWLAAPESTSSSNRFSVNQWAAQLRDEIGQHRAIIAPQTPETLAVLGLLAGQTGQALFPDVTETKGDADTPNGWPTRCLLPRLEQQAGCWVALPVKPGWFMTLRHRHDDALSASLPSTRTLDCRTLSAIEPDTAKHTLTFERRTRLSHALEDARMVVAGGRALGPHFMDELTPLVNRLGAAMGATRGAVDAGHAPAHCQIGLTGAVIAPDIYIAVGISGAPQHIAGMAQSRCIVAINTDAAAPVVQYADYLLQGDMFDVLPALVARLKDRDKGAS